MKRLLGMTLVAVSLQASADPVMDRNARKLGALCGLDMRSADMVAYVKRQPAFYWVMATGLMSSDGDISASMLSAVKPAIKCGTNRILVDEVVAAKLLKEQHSHRVEGSHSHATVVQNKGT